MTEGFALNDFAYLTSVTAQKAYAIGTNSGDPFIAEEITLAKCESLTTEGGV